MKIVYNFFFLLIIGFSNLFYSQSDYSIGISFGSGLNIYKNTLDTDKNHFKFNNTISTYLGIKLLKPLNETNNLYAELVYTRKKIEMEYNLNEPAIPFNSTDIIGQKYDCFSIHFGYRKNLLLNVNSLYFESSVGADFNNNVIVYNKGNGESLDGQNGIISYENFANTHLGDKSITMSGNIGLGYNFGSRNQFDLGININIPFQNIQTEESTFLYKWKYQNKEYIYNQNYIGKIFYPSVKLTYYAF